MGGWRASATIPSGQGAGLGGRLDFSPGNQLQWVTLHPRAVLAGLVDLGSFDITYHPRHGLDRVCPVTHHSGGAHIASASRPRAS